MILMMHKDARLGGDFMWRQAYKYAANSNINTIWMAQFDEVDEGTAIMKVAKTDDGNPVDGNFLALEAMINPYT